MRPVYRFPSGDAHLANIRAMAEFCARFATGAGPEPKRVSPAPPGNGEPVSSPNNGRFFLFVAGAASSSRSRSRAFPFARTALFSSSTSRALSSSVRVTVSRRLSRPNPPLPPSSPFAAARLAKSPATPFLFARANFFCSAAQSSRAAPRNVGHLPLKKSPHVKIRLSDKRGERAEVDGGGEGGGVVA